MPRPTHTPGPWRPATLGRRFGGPYYAVVADHPTTPGSEQDVPHYGGHLVAESIPERDVHLIAAAPLMLEALENLENDDGSTMPESAWRLVQQAIAAARGES